MSPMSRPHIPNPLHALRSLQWQLAASYAAMAALLCTALGLVVMHALGGLLFTQDRAEVQSRAAIVGDLIYRSLTANTNLPLLLDEASQYAHARVCISDSSGTVLQDGCSDAGLLAIPDGDPRPSIDYEVQSNPTPIALYAA